MREARLPDIRNGPFGSRGALVPATYNAWYARPVPAKASLPVATPLTVRSSPALREAEGRLAKAAGRDVGKRSTRIPADAMVSVASGKLLPAPARRPTLALAAPPPTSTANDNKAAPTSRSALRIVVRQLVFLAILAATIIGAFYSGRLHAFQNVIVVPETTSHRSVIT